MNQTTKPHTQDSQEDFQKATEFYELLLKEIGEVSLAQLTVSFPQKYVTKKQFFEQFDQLDEIERIMWCNHHLKEAYCEYTSKREQDSARRNILWTLLLCKQFKIKLMREYHLMKMIKCLWLYELSAKEEVTTKLKQIFQALGEYDEKKIKVRTQQQLPDQKQKRENFCGCMGNKCLIF